VGHIVVEEIRNAGRRVKLERKLGLKIKKANE
jgi:hypothetical protein